MHTQEELETSKLELASSLKKLYKNKEFKKIVLEGFLENGATNLTRNLTKVKPEYEDMLIVDMKARSILWKFLDGIEEEAASIMEARAL